MSNLYLLCGTPGSGKSTFAKEIFPKYFSDHPYKIISRDTIRFSLLKDGEKYSIPDNYRVMQANASKEPVKEFFNFQMRDAFVELLSKDKYAKVNNIGHCLGRTCVYAWSLAALINIIPQELFDGEYIINITEGIDNKWIITYDHYKNRNHSFYGLSTGADNLVDACYEMILKLHELKML